MTPAAVPAATYRLQFNASFPFAAAAAIVDYLDALGVSHCYASSYLAAVPGSTHGYDVADPSRLNPDLGGDDSYAGWIDALRRHGMGHIVDVVPNHMGIAKSANPWWQDVLENGPNSRQARVFDIDWHPLKPELEEKVLLPILGDAYGAVLERQEIRLEYINGAFRARYFDQVLPISPGTYDRVLETGRPALLDALGPESPDAVELLSILTAIRHLPERHVSDPALRAERAREKEVIKRRLAALEARSPQVRDHIARAVETLNGRRGDPPSFDALDALLSAQSYRLAHWRVAAEEINYRRFFDINELAAIRMEDTVVFDRVHALLFDRVACGASDGLRIDHVDGLYDPGDYLERLQQRARDRRPDVYGPDRPLYVVVEKILGADEELPPWPVAGTTGYDFLAHVNGLFVDGRNESALTNVYERFTRTRGRFRDLAYWGKELVLRLSMASELNVLAHGINRFSERNRYCRDFTLNSLAHAVREIIACFPVYRTYVNAREPVSARDRGYIEHAVREAKRRNPRTPALVFDFIRDLLLLKADYIPEPERDEHIRLVGKFQQVTSPVTAKGIEDTALYLYNRLASLNEVGSEPDRFGVAPEALHHWLAARAARLPHGLSTLTTHDTKRSEDVRARLNVLSELPGAWKQAISRWAQANRRGRTIIDGESYPSRNEEYLLYQTLVGTWPLTPMPPAGARAYRDRIVAYMHKAMREAKVFTSWVSPSERHEQAMTRFIDTALAPDNRAFHDDFVQFARRVAGYGTYNSLAQVAVKIGAPGVPDFYQGTEIWDFSLVDPDNRRPVDYTRRRALLEELDAALASEGPAALAARLIAAPEDDRLKLYATSTLLRFRRAHLAIFQRGGYDPITADGPRREHVFAFARTHAGQRALVVVPRLVATLVPDGETPPIGERVWGDTRLLLPEGGPRLYRHALTGDCIRVQGGGDGEHVALADVFARFPIAVLEGH
ncbi:MAG: malto-oligosyltrehalose synthase [Acidobacteria bacterium]|nr:malto-oligosyltrehalose synthase [Acidobacteriota bacterium]